MAGHSNTIADLYAAFARGDIPAVLATLSPNIRWTEAEGFPYGGTYVGPDAVLQQVFARLGSEWDGYAAVPHEFVADADTVIALGEYSGTYKATGKSFKAPFVHVWKFDADRVVSFRQHTDTAVVQRALQ
ncbi:MAG: nuclear transport factor 2 family protein [Proteobacteria bacterium]|nr:nuclear transport factor 2 family protein [Pseudomonadota bacterium]